MVPKTTKEALKIVEELKAADVQQHGTHNFTSSTTTIADVLEYLLLRLKAVGPPLDEAATRPLANASEIEGWKRIRVAPGERLTLKEDVYVEGDLPPDAIIVTNGWRIFVSGDVLGQVTNV
jgi:hypothetical protein